MNWRRNDIFILLVKNKSLLHFKYFFLFCFVFYVPYFLLIFFLSLYIHSYKLCVSCSFKEGRKVEERKERRKRGGEGRGEGERKEESEEGKPPIYIDSLGNLNLSGILLVASTCY